MQFLMLYKPVRARTGGVPLTDGEGAVMEQLIEEQMKSGELLASCRLQPLAEGAFMRKDKGSIGPSDGPYGETKEVIGGLAFMEFPSLEVALKATEEFLKFAGDGEVEIRPVAHFLGRMGG